MIYLKKEGNYIDNITASLIHLHLNMLSWNISCYVPKDTPENILYMWLSFVLYITGGKKRVKVYCLEL